MKTTSARMGWPAGGSAKMLSEQHFVASDSSMDSFLTLDWKLGNE